MYCQSEIEMKPKCAKQCGHCKEYYKPLVQEKSNIMMENQNSVAFVTKVAEISDIEGADKIELVKVEGWTSVVQKGSLNPGDRVICLTTNAVIPGDYAKEHNIDTYLRKGSRVRTVKLRGVYSECILLKASDDLKIGQDMQKELGVYKYEPPVIEVTTSSGKKLKKSVNPHFYVYHKFPNAKNVPNLFTDDDYVQITRKIHGSNFRASISKKNKLSLFDKIKKLFGSKKVDYEFCYGSRTVQKFGKADTGFYGKDYWAEMVKKYDLENKLWSLLDILGVFTVGEGITVYGEIYGEGVQGDKYTYGVKGRELKMFDMTVNGEYLGGGWKNEYFNFVGLPVVEMLYQGWYSKEVVDELVNNQFIKDTKIPHEGVVVSVISGDRTKVAKFINPDYLIYSEKYQIPDSH